MAGLQALQLAILKNKKILSRSAALDCSRSEGGRVGLADLDSFADTCRYHPTVYQVARSFCSRNLFDRGTVRQSCG